MELTHINQNGEARMVDVGEKTLTARVATAEAVVHMRPATLDAIRAGNTKKGDVLGAARIAAIQAAKRTWELIPLCHPIPISGIDVQVKPRGGGAVAVRCTVRCAYATGVEMEALCAASVGALTIYDMCKAVDRAMVIGETRLLYKSGGKSGEFDRSAPGEVLSVLATGGAAPGMLILCMESAGPVPASGQDASAALCAAARQIDPLPALAVAVSGPAALKRGWRLCLGGALAEVADDAPVRLDSGLVCWRAVTVQPGGLDPGARIEVRHD